MTGESWIDRTKSVDLRRSRAVNASPEAVWAVVSRSDAGLLFASCALVIPVPGTEVSCEIHAYDGQLFVRVNERLPVEIPWGIRTVDRTTAITRTVVVEATRGGARVHLDQSAVASRPVARQYRDSFEAWATPWLDLVALVASGFQPFPAARYDLVRAADTLGAATASIPGTRIVAASPQRVWDVLTVSPSGAAVDTSVPAEDSLRFWVGEAPVAVGSWLGGLSSDERRSAAFSEVTELAEGERITLRSVAGHQHPALTSWTLLPVPGGTQVTVIHECSTSHVGLPDVVGLTLDRLELRVASA